MKYNSSDVKCMVRPINCKQCDRPSVDDLYWDYRLLDGNRGGEFFTQWFVPVPVHFLKETGELCGPLRHDFEDTVRVDDHFIRDLVNTLRDGELLNLGACWRDKSGVFRIIYSRIPCSPDYSFSGVVIYATWWFKQPLGPHPYMVILAGKPHLKLVKRPRRIVTLCHFELDPNSDAKTSGFLQSLILTTILSVIRLH
ncbi:hypothetical protein AB6A40_009151 [Gnathostoma spinigerum]|uniref:Uncharacterized protein n=1 Tax=Gnathostoma spinigerum TaxID=75299 RepID=A0ABD6F026_9BILA